MLGRGEVGLACISAVNHPRHATNRSGRSQNFHKITVFVTETHLLSTGEGGWAVSFLAFFSVSFCVFLSLLFCFFFFSIFRKIIFLPRGLTVRE